MQKIIPGERMVKKYRLDEYVFIRWYYSHIRIDSPVYWGIICQKEDSATAWLDKVIAKAISIVGHRKLYIQINAPHELVIEWVYNTYESEGTIGPNDDKEEEFTQRINEHFKDNLILPIRMSLHDPY
jgi:hypothetical protein